MLAATRRSPAPPLLGAAAIRRVRRSLLALIVALITVTTVAHHLLPEHAGMPVAGGGTAPAGHAHHGGAAAHGEHAGHDDAPMQLDHAMPAMAMCLGVLGGGFVLLYVGAVVRTPRSRRRRTAAPRGLRRSGRLPGRAACRDGPPTFLRLQVLRT